MESTDPPKVLALVRDLIFASKISAAARAQGVEATILRDAAQLLGRSGPLLLVDLNQPGAIAAAGEWKKAENGRVIGFVSHVDTVAISRAREAGLDQVMARSGFVEALPGLVGTLRR